MTLSDGFLIRPKSRLIDCVIKCDAKRHDSAFQFVAITLVDVVWHQVNCDVKCDATRTNAFQSQYRSATSLAIRNKRLNQKVPVITGTNTIAWSVPVRSPAA